MADPPAWKPPGWKRRRRSQRLSSVDVAQRLIVTEVVSPPAWKTSGLEGIPSDPELENQINDRWSFKKFLGLPLDASSPLRGVGPSGPEADHSTFSRFRSRLSTEAMAWINNEVLQQFAQKGMTINEGIASGLEGVRASDQCTLFMQ